MAFGQQQPGKHINNLSTIRVAWFWNDNPPFWGRESVLKFKLSRLLGVAFGDRTRFFAPQERLGEAAYFVVVVG